MDKELKFAHPTLAAGRWDNFSLNFQMMTIGSEISRAIKWRESHPNRSICAVGYALELTALTKESLIRKNRKHALREICRSYEIIADFFFGDNIYNTTAEDLQRYYDWRPYHDNSNNRARADWRLDGESLQSGGAHDSRI